MGKKLYIGNLPYTITESELRELFERHGTVASVNVITDRETGRARGFAFVEFEDANGAQAAMQALDGTQVGGRTLRVNEANERGGGGVAAAAVAAAAGAAAATVVVAAAAVAATATDPLPLARS